MNTQHVLIVEDEFAIASLLKINLEIAGFSVTHAHNLTCAKAMVYETLPDVLILDWMLPEGEGFSLLKYIRSSEK